MKKATTTKKLNARRIKALRSAQGIEKRSRNLFQTGNKKIDRTVLVYSQTPMLTCPNCTSCSATCYAMKSYRQYPNVRASWDGNFEMSLTDPDLFIMRAVYQIKKRKRAYVRIHSAGDFYSVTYINSWIEIARACPGVIFWTYTKSAINPAMTAALDELNSLPNVNIVNSVWTDGRINYGTPEYLDTLYRDITAAGHDCYICPCGRDKSIKCGKSCHACSTYEYVLFDIH